jgi:hypothetical protein
MLEVRPLRPLEDLSLLAAVYGWARGAPGWLRESQGVWGREGFGPFALAHLEERTTFGLFGGGRMFAAVTLDAWGAGLYECHLSARKGADAGDVTGCAVELRNRLFAAGARELFAWVDARNRGARDVLTACDFRDAGLVMLKGERRGRLIEWRLMVTNNAQQQAEGGADAVPAGEHVLVAERARDGGRAGSEGDEVRG